VEKRFTRGKSLSAAVNSIAATLRYAMPHQPVPLAGHPTTPRMPLMGGAKIELLRLNFTS